MQSVEFISGFTDLKKQFAFKAAGHKDINDFYLWFTELNGDIYVHDYENHDLNMLIAFYNSKNELKILLAPNGPAFKLINQIVEAKRFRGDTKKVSNQLNSLFRLFGTYPIRFLKLPL
jgi:hypothetical protein